MIAKRMTAVSGTQVLMLNAYAPNDGIGESAWKSKIGKNRARRCLMPSPGEQRNIESWFFFFRWFCEREKCALSVRIYFQIYVVRTHAPNTILQTSNPSICAQFVLHVVRDLLLKVSSNRRLCLRWDLRARVAYGTRMIKAMAKVLTKFFGKLLLSLMLLLPLPNWWSLVRLSARIRTSSSSAQIAYWIIIERRQYNRIRSTLFHLFCLHWCVSVCGMVECTSERR